VMSILQLEVDLEFNCANEGPKLTKEKSTSHISRRLEGVSSLLGNLSLPLYLSTS
jgi:hypothetical protein